MTGGVRIGVEGNAVKLSEICDDPYRRKGSEGSNGSEGSHGPQMR